MVMDKRFLIGVVVCVLVFFAGWWWGFESPIRLGVVESTIQNESQSNTAVTLSRITKVDSELAGSVASVESNPSEVEGITTFILSLRIMS